MSRTRHLILVTLLVVASISCRKKNAISSATTTSAELAPEEATLEAPPQEALPLAPSLHVEPLVVWKDVGLSSPKSIVHDEVNDVYLVSNIEGAPFAADRRGFISKLSPDGKVIDLKWIESGKNKVLLNAPKGMAVSSDRLYVADIDIVRIFNRKTGAPIGYAKIPGATFLSGLTIAPDGRVLVSDTGLVPGPGGLERSDSDAVYAIGRDKKVRLIAKSKNLSGPNGLAPAGQRMWVVSFGSGEIYSIDTKGRTNHVQQLPKGGLDGIVFVGEEALISSWMGNAIYRGKPGGEFRPVVDDVRSPSGIAYDYKRGRLIVPLLFDDEVRVYDLK